MSRSKRPNNPTPTVPTAEQAEPTAEQAEPTGEQAEHTAEQAEQAEQAEPTSATAEQAGPTAADLFRTAYAAAIDAREPATGVIPLADVDAVRVAFRPLSKQERASVPAQLTADAMVRFADPVDVGGMVAAGALAAAVAQASTEPKSRASAPAPVGIDVGVAVDRALAALQYVRGYLRGEPIGDAPTDSAAYIDAIGAAIQRVSTAQVNPKRRKSSTPRAPGAPRATGRDLAPIIRDAASASGGWVTLGQLHKSHDVSRGAADNRWTADNVEGVTATTRDGVKGFATV